MAHINDLYPQDLYNILCLVLGEPAKKIDEWKQKLPLLHVCSKWYDLLKDHVFSQAFIDVYPSRSERYRKSANTNSCVYYADDNIVCISNLGIIIGRDEYNCDCVSELKVSVYHYLEIGHYAPVLEKLLALGVGYWINLTSLKLIIGDNYDYLIKPENMSLDEFADNVRKYVCKLYDKAPNISCLQFEDFDGKLLSSAFSILIGQYSHRLQSLHIGYPIKALLPAFATELTSLSLNLDHYTHWKPTIYAKPLRFLELRRMRSSTFSWWIFHDFTTPGCIEFTNLETLELNYQGQIDKEDRLSEKFSKQARPYGSHMLRFPKLQNLSLKSPPIDCDVFYTDTIPTNMDSYFISGSPSMIVATSRLRFKRVNKLDIFTNADALPNNDFYKAADYYFGYTEIGHSCKLLTNLQIDIMRTVSWVNITELSLEAIDFNNLLKLIPNLYKLQNLSAFEIYLNSECLLIIQSGLEEEMQGVFQLLETKLEFFSTKKVESDNPHYLLSLLNHLLLRAPTLKRVETSEKMYSFVDKSFLPEKFQHIAFVCY